MDAGFGSVADAILSELCRDGLGAPGVVAMVTNREGEFYRGAAGVRTLGANAPMTLDTIFSLYSCTKAITATAALRLDEEGRLDLDAPAKLYSPEIADLRVVDGFDDSGPAIAGPQLLNSPSSHRCFWHSCSASSCSGPTSRWCTVCSSLLPRRRARRSQD